ncbi:MAG: GTPase HflX [Fimbriimonadaceae bacterium]|nr:GTPase HflX [Fimbriimonadaceae bacterium]
MTRASHHHEPEKERAFLVFVNTDEADDAPMELELEGLVEAAEGSVVGMTRQRVDRPFKATYLGSGKVNEVAAAAKETDAEIVVVDTELSGIQIRNLEEIIEKRVVDRTALILDIFARRARTREGQLQVEYAQLNYRLPRLMSVYTKFERQRGGIGMRGPGETKLEADRRMIKDRISHLKKEIDGVKRHRSVQREARLHQPHANVSLVGYTSAGKSTLMNALCQTDLLADAMPFATLDPTTRKVELEEGFAFFLTDTVGFIRALPTSLVAAFRATLEEVSSADLLLHVIDVSADDWEMQRDAVLATVEELGAGEVPMLTVFNKVDAVEDERDVEEILKEFPNSVAVSALKGDGLAELLQQVVSQLRDRWIHVNVTLPYSHNHLVDECYRRGRVASVDYREDGVHIDADVDHALGAQLNALANA